MGVGTRLGNGCTSGHGVCGIPRLSIRSIVATATFILFAMMISSIRYKWEFLNAGLAYSNVYVETWQWITFGLFLAGHLFFLYMISKNRKSRSSVFELSMSYLIGIIFGLGLMISGMCRITKIAGFLTIDKDRWDPSLLFVMGSAVAINLPIWQYLLKKSNGPICCPKFSLPTNNKVDAKLIGGSALFGLGWGLSALCPGPGLINFFILTHVIFWLGGYIIGALIFNKEEAPLILGTHIT